MSGNEILGAILDLSAEGRPAPEAVDGIAGDRPTDLELLGRAALGLPRYPLRVLKALPSTLPNLEDAGALSTLPGVGLVTRVAGEVQRAFGGEAPQLGREKLTPPHTTFNGRVSPHRRIVIGQLSLEQVREVKNLHGCTVNDVIVSMVAGTVRRWLLHHGELPDTPLVAQIPVSVRTEEQMGTYGNRILLMGAPLYTNIGDPVERLLVTHDALMDMKARHRALPAELLTDANQFIPPAVFARAARATFTVASSKRGRPLWNLVISNVPGPPVPLYCAGARLKANYPISVITDGMGLNITVLSYCGSLDFGLVGDREQMPDLAALMTGLEAELTSLLPKPAVKPVKAKVVKAKAKAS